MNIGSLFQLLIELQEIKVNVVINSRDLKSNYNSENKIYL